MGDVLVAQNKAMLVGAILDYSRIALLFVIKLLVILSKLQ